MILGTHYFGLISANIFFIRGTTHQKDISGRQHRTTEGKAGHGVLSIADIDSLPPWFCRQLACIVIGSPFDLWQHQQIVGRGVGQHVGRAVPIIYIVGSELYGLLPGAQMQESVSGQVQEQGREDRRGQGGFLQVLQRGELLHLVRRRIA